MKFELGVGPLESRQSCDDRRDAEWSDRRSVDRSHRRGRNLISSSVVSGEMCWRLFSSDALARIAWSLAALIVGSWVVPALVRRAMGRYWQGRLRRNAGKEGFGDVLSVQIRLFHHDHASN